MKPHETCYNCDGKGAHNAGCPALDYAARGDLLALFDSYGNACYHRQSDMAELRERFIAALASTRTASDTRTAVGEAECDAALGRAAPAGQHDAIAAARARLEAKWDSEGECGSCGWHAALYEHNVEDWEIAHALEKNGGVLELSCVSKDDDDASSHRGVKINIAPSREESAASRCGAQGRITQPESVESARPAEVDVEAERKLFEAWSTGPDGEWIASGMWRDGDGKYGEVEVAAQWKIWLAARTQADAGKEREPRVYMDHGMWHDRQTGQHLFTQDEYDQHGRDRYENGRQEQRLETKRLATTKPENT